MPNEVVKFGDRTRHVPSGSWRVELPAERPLPGRYTLRWRIETSCMRVVNAKLLSRFLANSRTGHLQQALYLNRHERSKMDFDETSDKLIGLNSTRKWPNLCCRRWTRRGDGLGLPHVLSTRTMPVAAPSDAPT
jgi:hypothetical protein